MALAELAGPLGQTGLPLAQADFDPVDRHGDVRRNSYFAAELIAVRPERRQPKAQGGPGCRPGGALPAPAPDAARKSLRRRRTLRRFR